jgi:hypothetical protein
LEFNFEISSNFGLYNPHRLGLDTGFGEGRDSGLRLEAVGPSTHDSLGNLQYELLICLMNKAVFHASVERKYDLARMAIDVVREEFIAF